MTVGLDFPGVSLAPGDHLCGFYYGEDERDALLFPFLRTGLRAGEKCLAVVDSTTPADVVERIGPGTGPDDDSELPVDVAACLATGQLELYDSQQTYLRTGSFDADLMIEFWEEQARQNSEGRFTFARVVGEMSWLERVPPEREAVVKYETWADSFAARHPPRRPLPVRRPPAGQRHPARPDEDAPEAAPRRARAREPAPHLERRVRRRPRVSSSEMVNVP
jgi:hypothetical protein